MFGFNNVLLTEVTDKNGAVLACLQLTGPETPLNIMLPHHKSALWYNKFLYRHLFSKLIWINAHVCLFFGASQWQIKALPMFFFQGLFGKC